MTDPVAPDLFRDLFAGVPAPVAVVTTMAGGRPHGTTVSAFSALSLQPPLLLVSLDKGSELLREIKRHRTFCVNVLQLGQEELALHFARKATDKFDGIAWERRDDLPVIPGCQGWAVSDLARLVEAGDHVVVIGLVVGGEAGDGWPLLYHQRRFHGLAAPRDAPLGRGGVG